MHPTRLGDLSVVPKSREWPAQLGAQLDAAGLVLGWKLFDHAAHLGGALFGM